MAKPSPREFARRNRSKNIRAALKARGDKIAARATQINRAAGGTANYSVRSGIRPGGRAYTDVVSDNPWEEFGTEDVPRINALRQAARGG